MHVHIHVYVYVHMDVDMDIGMDMDTSCGSFYECFGSLNLQIKLLDSPYISIDYTYHGGTCTISITAAALLYNLVPAVVPALCTKSSRCIIII